MANHPLFFYIRKENKMLEQWIKIKSDFIGHHRFANASQMSPAISFLENTHRHKFLIEFQIQVFHDDREIEFFILKNQIDSFLTGLAQTMTAEKNSRNSCEQIGKMIINYVKKLYPSRRKMIVEVSEDGESSAIVNYTPDQNKKENHDPNIKTQKENFFNNPDISSIDLKKEILSIFSKIFKQ